MLKRLTVKILKMMGARNRGLIPMRLHRLQSRRSTRAIPLGLVPIPWVHQAEPVHHQKRTLPEWRTSSTCKSPTRRSTRPGALYPTSSLVANRLLEFRAIQRGDPIISADVESAFSHAAEVEDFYVRAPPEYIDKLREEVTSGARRDVTIAQINAGVYIKLLANVHGRRTAGKAWRDLFGTSRRSFFR